MSAFHRLTQGNRKLLAFLVVIVAAFCGLFVVRGDANAIGLYAAFGSLCTAALGALVTGNVLEHKAKAGAPEAQQ